MKATRALLTKTKASTHIRTHAHAPPGLLGGTYRALTKTSSADRSVHIKIHPRPRSLAESAQILALLRSYGEIEIFRHLKYDFDAPAPNSLLVVFKHASAASRVLAEDKIAFRYGSGSPASSANDEPIYSHTAPFPRPAELMIRRAELLHLPYIQRQRYYWPVAASPDSGRPGLALLGGLPPGLNGMRDFDVMRPEIRFRAREGWSRLWDENVRKRGWITLNQLNEKGRERKVKERGIIEEGLG